LNFKLTPTEIAAASLLVSAFTLGHGIWTRRPKITIENATLSLQHFSTQLREKSDGWLDRMSMSIKVEVMLANYLSQPGSITKPDLKILCKDKALVIHPVISHQETKDSHSKLPYIWNFYTVRDGASFSLAPYGRYDDELIYTLNFDKETIRFLLDHYDDMEFTLNYRDHKGKAKRFKIKNVTQK
jgi:hypothetical protein